MVSSDKNHYCLSLISLKDRGGLVYPSHNIIEILTKSESVFKAVVVGDDFKNPSITKDKFLRLKMKNTIIQELASNELFSTLREHDINYPPLCR